MPWALKTKQRLYSALERKRTRQNQVAHQDSMRDNKLRLGRRMSSLHSENRGLPKDAHRVWEAASKMRDRTAVLSRPVSLPQFLHSNLGGP
jgi:hypothetical protein